MSIQSNLTRPMCLVTMAGALMFAQAASAETLRLEKPSQAGWLHSAGVDISAYYLDQTAYLDVVVEFADQDSGRLPGRLRLRMVDGDDLDFAVPGRTDVSFGIIRTGKAIDVVANPLVESDLAASN